MLRSVGLRIDISTDNGQSFRTVGKLKTDLVRSLASISKLGCRLVRSNVKHCLKLDDGLFLIMAGKGIFHLDLNSKSIKQVADIQGSRPLQICQIGHTIYYGEYRSNSERSPIRVFRSDDAGLNWDVAYTFHDVRHVHGVFADPRDKSIWVTTGDFGNEAAVWQTKDDFETLTPRLIGSQQTRVIGLLFLDNEICFGTDAPEEENWLYRLIGDNEHPEKIQTVAGPVFHTLQMGKKCIFTTAKEPSQSNHSNQLEVWAYSRGKSRLISEFKKDFWSMRYFQYGQVLLTAAHCPTELEQDNRVWLTPFAAQGDQVSQLWSLND